MNLVAFGLILICCHAWAIETDDNPLGRGRYSLSSKLRDFLDNDLRSMIQNGNSDFNIPPLDPFVAANESINFHEPGLLDVDAVFANVQVNGLSRYIVNNADFKLFGMKVHVDVSWPLVIANATNYSGRAAGFGLEVYGTGEMNGAAHDFRLQGDITFTSKSKIQISKISNLKISLGALEFHATGLFNDDERSEAMSLEISNMAPEFIRDNQNMIVNTISSIAMKTANTYLSNIPTATIKKIINSIL